LIFVFVAKIKLLSLFCEKFDKNNFYFQSLYESESPKNGDSIYRNMSDTDSSGQ